MRKKNVDSACMRLIQSLPVKKEAVSGNCFKLEVPGNFLTTEAVIVATIGLSETNDAESSYGLESSFIRSICRDATRTQSNRSFLLPHLTYGRLTCNNDFPNGIYTGYERLLACICEFLNAVIDNGFRKILLAGTDRFLLSTAARMICRNTVAVCQVLNSHELIERALSMQNAYKKNRLDAEFSAAYKQRLDNHGSQLYEACVVQVAEMICDFKRLEPDIDN